MKKLSSKIFILAIVAALVTATLPLAAFASFSDIPANAYYKDSVERLSSLGIISGNSTGSFAPNANLTREQFAKMIVVAAGLNDTAAALKGTSKFSDVPATSWSSGYINVALNKGYITGMLDGKFHPTESLTYAQLCTILVRALGYVDPTDVPGQWPLNYIGKASTLGLTDSIALSSNNSVPRWVAAVMIDRMLDTNVKSLTGASQTFLASTGTYKQCLILGNATTDSSLSGNQLLTDAGTFYNSSNLNISPGGRYFLAVNSSNSITAAGLSNKVKNITVEQASEYKVTYTISGVSSSLTLPAGITYYYDGAKTDYTKIAALLEKNASIVFNYASDGTTFESAVIFAPVYSNPVIATNLNTTATGIGSIRFSDSPTILKDGKIIDAASIEYKDVVYAVSDIWGGNSYYLVIDNKVGGKITALSPNSISPSTIQINGSNYSISTDMDMSRIAISYGTFAIGNNITVFLGYDGKIVAVESFGADSASKYAYVLDSNYSFTVNDDGTRTFAYIAKMLFSDGYIATFNVQSNAATLKGDLVQYNIIDNDTLEITAVPLESPGLVIINKEARTLNGSYVSDNVIIINQEYDDSSAAFTASMLSWSDLPDGDIPSGKILTVKKSGAFNDVTLIMTNDIEGVNYRIGIVSSVLNANNKYTYNIFVDGTSYTYGTYISSTAINGALYRFRMSSSGISSMISEIQPRVTATQVEAIDSRRIKINGVINYLSSNVAVYHKDSYYSVTAKTLSDISTTRTYGKIELYSNTSSNDGKIEVIVLSD